MIKLNEIIIALSKIPKFGPMSVKQMMNNLDHESSLDIRDIHFELKKKISDLNINNLQKYLDSAKYEIERCENHSIAIKNYLDSSFPDSLKEINDFPLIIYIRGSGELLNKHDQNIAIIGTRKPSEIGKQLAFNTAEILSKKGNSIVSGLALGCDTFAHKGCLDSGGLTVAVLAHGLDTISPSSNTKLASQIIEKGGVLVSEYSIETPPQNFMYIQRNRIQSALAKAVILIESEINGGSMKTIRFAEKQGKEIWVYHPDTFSKMTSGNKKLIQTLNKANKKQISFLDPEDEEIKYKYFTSTNDIKKLL